MAADGAETAASLKEEGNAKFKAGEYEAATTAYTKSLALDATQHLCYSNRSAAYLKLGTAPEQALEDANKCVEISVAWAKGYSRKAAALQALKRWEEAAQTCEAGLKACGADDSLSKMLREVRNRKFQDELKGTWHGVVSEELGGYEQEIEFMDDTSVRVEVVGRAIIGRYWVDTSDQPYKLDIQVPMQDAPPGMPPPPPVPYIARLDDKGLHLCCPVMSLDRPTKFEGVGYCRMERGSVAATDNSEIEKLSRDEKLKRCAEELLKVLPERKLEEVSQTDSEDVVRTKMLTQVKFESSMYAIAKQYTEEIMKEVLDATKADAKDVPASLQKGTELAQLKERLKQCGIFEEDAAAAGAAAAAASTASAPPKPKPPPAEKAPAVDEALGNSMVFPLAAAGAAVAMAAVAYMVWKRQKK